ncbi:ERF family protein [Sphingobium sp. AntQ-1]|uniref:ERF family protein n=1 Tax=Sphingobium sp. AntQ-1 TaxID=2930091 RepID=UPI00234E4A3A|nr:ERF family protein [Sphingobium sp. AntQ-1]
MGGGILAVIDRAVRDPSVDVEKMERLLAMHERVMAESARKSFMAAFRDAKQEMKSVVRNKYNEQTKSGYADLDAVSAQIDPICEKHGFSMSFGSFPATKEGHYGVSCVLMHEEGHEKEYSAEVPADMTGMKGNQNKTATHGFGSTMSYGRRYLKLMVWDIATRDDDGNDASAIETINPEQAQQLRDMLNIKGKSEPRFVTFLNDKCSYSIAKIEDLWASDFAAVLTTLKAA